MDRIGSLVGSGSGGGADLCSQSGEGDEDSLCHNACSLHYNEGHCVPSVVEEGELDCQCLMICDGVRFPLGACWVGGPQCQGVDRQTIADSRGGVECKII